MMRRLIAFVVVIQASAKDVLGSYGDDRQLQNKVISDPCAVVKCSADFPKCVVTSQGNAQCSQDVCQNTICNAGEVCFGRTVQCITAPCPPIPECITDPCAVLNACPMDTGCVVDNAGNAVCISTPGGFPIDPPLSCAAVTCPIEAPVCIIKADGSADCVQNACQGGDFICNAASTCEIDKQGNPFCQPLPGNPGNPITCANVKCSSETPYCVETPGGTVECLADPCRSGSLVCNAASKCVVDSNGKPSCQPLPGNFPPPWWDNVNKYQKGTAISRCNLRGDSPPKEGERCARKSKTCFFSSQLCDGIGVFPSIRCDCVGQKWSCKNNITCPQLSSGGGSAGPWPECLGITGDQCCKLIEVLAPDVQGNCIVILEGTPVTKDLRMNRVRVFVNNVSVVTQIPRRG